MSLKQTNPTPVELSCYLLDPSSISRAVADFVAHYNVAPDGLFLLRDSLPQFLSSGMLHFFLPEVVASRLKAGLLGHIHTSFLQHGVPTLAVLRVVTDANDSPVNIATCDYGMMLSNEEHDLIKTYKFPAVKELIHRLESLSIHWTPVLMTQAVYVFMKAYDCAPDTLNLTNATLPHILTTSFKFCFHAETDPERVLNGNHGVLRWSSSGIHVKLNVVTESWNSVENIHPKDVFTLTNIGKSVSKTFSS